MCNGKELRKHVMGIHGHLICTQSLLQLTQYAGEADVHSHDMY